MELYAAVNSRYPRRSCQAFPTHIPGLLIFVVYLFSGVVCACENALARAVSLQGDVEVRTSLDVRWVRVRLDNAVCPGDAVRVGQNSRAALVLSDTTLLRLDQNTTVSFPDRVDETNAWVSLRVGIAHFIARVRQSFEVVTPFMNAGIEGTEFTVTVQNDRAQVTVFEGRVRAHNALGQLSLAPGQSAEAQRGQAPVLKVIVRPRDAVQWALYYPAILGEIDPAPFAKLPASMQVLLERSLAAYRQSDNTAALTELAGLPQDLQTLSTNVSPGPAADFSAVYTYRAALYLGVGRVSEAQADLAQALKSRPVKTAPALALQAIIAVVQNDKNAALRLAQQAVQADPNDSAAGLSLSYARQAHFDIPGALAAVAETVEHHPGDALNWSRLAELQLSSGNLPAALDAAQRATTINPELARTQSVLGFAWLAQFNLTEAQAAFQRALELDQADPLPRLGLGLADIRVGRLAQGRREIEIAASLDPDSSLIRSYLGKAYYDEKRDPLAATELTTAKQLDPFDPTPWFYDAIRKQTENQPVAALQDLQKSIALNDNRAVYRSKLLLDSDLAARSASLGRVYGDLGFEQLGLIEGYKSVASDPADYSAHRLLADNYAALPRHEIARVSELLQSQLLQPLNLTSLQPQLAESNLAILEGAGPSSQSFSEFNPLFTRNRTAFLANAIFGSNNTLGNDLVLSGLTDRFAYSLGQFHYETDGFRQNNDQDIDIYNAFGQVSLSPDTSIQAEYRHKETENGDLPLRFFDAQDFFDEQSRNNLRIRTDTDTYRLGFHHALTPRSTIIASAVYQDRVEKQELQDFFASRVGFRGYSTEAQYLFSAPSFHVVAGVGHFNLDAQANVELFLIDGLPADAFNLQLDNAYFYSTSTFPAHLKWTAGVDFDHVNSEIIGSFNQLNPKFGVEWDLTSATTLRLAAFKVLKRNLIAQQTIEPTQVAGFNQFFDDPNSTESIRYGLALDQKFAENFYGGLEVSDRNLKVPIIGGSPNERAERLYRAYIHYAFSNNLSLNLEYEREVFINHTSQPFILQLAPDTKTQRIPLFLRYFHPNGLFARLGTTYVSQKVNNGNEKSADEFVLLDTTFGYRLPGRHGIISLQIDNLFDEKFRYQGLVSRTSDTQTTSPPFLPERTIFARFTLSF